jgi:hypothetical protein
MNMTVFWGVAQSSLVDIYQCFRGACYLHHHPDDGGDSHLKKQINYIVVKIVSSSNIVEHSKIERDLPLLM